ACSLCGVGPVTTVGMLDLGPSGDRPRLLRPSYSRVDWIFRTSTRVIAASVLVIMGLVGLFLGLNVYPTVHRYRPGIFTGAVWMLHRNIVGILSALVGTIEIAILALLVAFPLALSTALYITEYAPRRLKPFLVALVDLMAAVPSIVVGLWAASFLQP